MLIKYKRIGSKLVLMPGTQRIGSKSGDFDHQGQKVNVKR